MKLTDIQNKVHELITEGYKRHPGKYLIIQMPVTEWNDLRSYVKEICPVRRYCEEHCPRENFVYAGEAMVAGSHWAVGPVL